MSPQWGGFGATLALCWAHVGPSRALEALSSPKVGLRRTSRKISSQGCPTRERHGFLIISFDSDFNLIFNMDSHTVCNRDLNIACTVNFSLIFYMDFKIEVLYDFQH